MFLELYQPALKKTGWAQEWIVNNNNNKVKKEQNPFKLKCWECFPFLVSSSINSEEYFHICIIIIGREAMQEESKIQVRQKPDGRDERDFCFLWNGLFKRVQVGSNSE